MKDTTANTVDATFKAALCQAPFTAFIKTLALKWNAVDSMLYKPFAARLLPFGECSDSFNHFAGALALKYRKYFRRCPSRSLVLC